MRPQLSRLSKSKAALIGAASIAAVAVVGTTVGYASLSAAATSVTLNVDGHVEHVTAAGDTVGAVLDSQHITIGKHDQVAPSLDAPVTDGSAIAVRYGKPLHLTVDGKTSTYWVTATHVRGALQQVDRSFNRAALSVNRGATITRSGLRISVATPKRLTIVLGGKHAVHRTIAAMTVGQALRQLHVHLGKHDVVRPGLHHRLGNGDKLVLTRIRVVRHQISAETVPYTTVTRSDSSMLRGHTAVVRAGRTGSRDVTYRLTYRNGRLVARRVVTADVLRAPVAEIERVGTKTVAPTTNFAGGTTVWDKIAQCESGGNWATNTGNGYYGGLQFSLGTWHAYGGSGLPSSASRLTQIAIATKVRNATGGYGSWPACSQALGLPQ